MRALSSTLLLVLAAAQSGCQSDAFCFTCEEAQADAASNDAQPAEDGLVVPDGAGGFFIDGAAGGASDAAEAGDACEADTKTDPKNCGTCGNVCEMPGAFPKCVDGVCAIDSCGPGRYDLNQNPSDGCEYACMPLTSGVEACNSKDDDCDGAIDEGFNLETDPDNCGVCGNKCALPHASAKCAKDQGVVRCVVDSCEAGYSDPDKLASDGCEYACPVVPAVVELCNDLDDDCDGVVNNGNPGGGQSCEGNCPGGVCQGECTPGTTACIGTQLQCLGGEGPTLEICDNKDNDCDGVQDNGFDVSTDPLNCGACGQVCSLANAVGGCTAGTCTISACAPGYADLDADAVTGCEHACQVTPPVVETCNGLDDDCNGVTDDAAAIAVQKPAAVLCQPKAGTPCEGADFACTGATGWRCSYGPGAEVLANGKLASVEALCDGIDGNCNGQVDETFQDLGTACDNGLLGACRDQGKRVCNQGKDGTLCDLSPLPDPVAGAPGTEECNGIDDDCDGTIDDEIVDDMVQVTSGSVTFWIDRWEASRPDATSTTVGTSSARSCTKSGVLPWTGVTQSGAVAACDTRGARLCTAAEQQAACGGAAANAYPYGMLYQPGTCNGIDLGAGDLVPGGDPSLSACVTDTGIHELSGNAAEWTSTQTGTTGAPSNTPIYQVRGGSYSTPSLGLTCQFSLSRYAATAVLPDLGFRCCKD